MSAPDWQLTVLHELGVAPTGLIPTAATTPVVPVLRSLPSSGEAAAGHGHPGIPVVQPSLDNRTLLDFPSSPAPAPLVKTSLDDRTLLDFPPSPAPVPPVRPSLDNRTLLDFPPSASAPLAAPVLTPGPPPRTTAEPASRPVPATPGRHALPQPSPVAQQANGQPQAFAPAQPMLGQRQSPESPPTGQPQAGAVSQHPIDQPQVLAPAQPMLGQQQPPEPHPADQPQPGAVVQQTIGQPEASSAQGALLGAPAHVPPGHNHPPVLVGAPPDASALVRRAKHGDPLVRRVRRGVRRVVGAHAAQDVRGLQETGAKLGQPVATCRQIAFTSIRGGAGKTTVASLVAQTISQHRDGRTLAIDADPNLGSLALRLGARNERNHREIADSLPRSWEDAEAFLSRTGDRLWVASATTGRRVQGELQLPAFRTALGGLSRYFSAAVIDCGAGLITELHRGVLESAHGQVLVTPGTVDGALSTRGALDWFQENGFGPLLSRTVVALVSHTPHGDADIDKAAEMLGDLPVIHLPYDRHLAAGNVIDPLLLSTGSRLAATQIATEAFDRSTRA
jgi:MinD-like ATPase involved in chromosome partitioning or flagellar assembly